MGAYGAPRADPSGSSSMEAALLGEMQIPSDRKGDLVVGTDMKGGPDPCTVLQVSDCCSTQ